MSIVIGFGVCKGNQLYTTAEVGTGREGSCEEAPLSARRKLGLLLKYILDSWKKRDLSEDK